jgi:hypothetical protein
MKLLPLITSASIVLLLAQSAPAKQAKLPVTQPSSIAMAQAKVCEQFAATQRSANQNGDQRAKLMAESRKPPRQSTVGKALREFHPGGKATLSDHSEHEIVFISTRLEKGESSAIMKSPRDVNCNFPNTYTLIKSVSDGKGHPFMEEYVVMYLP